MCAHQILEETKALVSFLLLPSLVLSLIGYQEYYLFVAIIFDIALLFVSLFIELILRWKISRLPDNIFEIKKPAIQQGLFFVGHYGTWHFFYHIKSRKFKKLKIPEGFTIKLNYGTYNIFYTENLLLSAQLIHDNASLEFVEDYNQYLQKEFGFSDKDFQANTLGQLTQAQWAKVFGAWIYLSLFPFFWFIFAVFLGLTFFKVMWLALLFAIFPLLFLKFFIRSFGIFLCINKVGHYIGKIKWRIRGKGRVLYLQKEQRELETLAIATIDDRYTYEVYYAKYIDWLLSIKVIRKENNIKKNDEDTP
jgi:hypothetical protein